MNICSVIYPLYFIGRTLGVQPYSFKNAGNRKTPFTSKRDFVYCFMYVIIFLCMTIYTFQTEESDENNFVVVPKYIVLIESAIMVVLAYIYIILTFVFRKRIIKSIKHFISIDDTFKNTNIDLEYSKAKKRTNLKIVYITLSAVIRIFMMINTINITFIEQVLLCLTTVIKSVAKNIFEIIVIQIRSRYEIINETIQSMFIYEASFMSTTSNYKIRYITKMLYILCRLHYKLRTIVQHVIVAYAIQILMHLGAALSNIIFQSYFLYALIASHQDKISFYYIGSTISWLFDEIYEVYMLVKACATTSNTAADTARILHKLRNNIKNVELESHVQMYSLQMLHQQIEFSTLGFVTVDYNLLYSIIGAVTTYLVILIQFDQAQLSMSNSRIQLNSTTSP